MGLGMSAHQRPFEELAWLDGAGFTHRWPATPAGRTRRSARRPKTREAGWSGPGRHDPDRGAGDARRAGARGPVHGAPGVDTRVGSRLLVGVAASAQPRQARLHARRAGGCRPAAVDGDLTSAQPYLQWTPRAGLEVWGSGGTGRGALQVVDTFGTVDTGLGMRMGAGGMRQEVTAGGGLAVKADVFTWPRRRTPTWTCRRRGRRPPGRGCCSSGSRSGPRRRRRGCPRLEVGGRWDGGSDVDGFGSEVGGGVALAHVGLGLELSASGRYLLAHQAEGFEEWGASLALRAGPGVTRAGAWVSVEPEWGAAASRMHAMWGAAAGPGAPPRRGARPLGAEPGAAAAGGRVRPARGRHRPPRGNDARDLRPRSPARASGCGSPPRSAGSRQTTLRPPIRTSRSSEPDAPRGARGHWFLGTGIPAKWEHSRRPLASGTMTSLPRPRRVNEPARYLRSHPCTPAPGSARRKPTGPPRLP